MKSEIKLSCLLGAGIVSGLTAAVLIACALAAAVWMIRSPVFGAGRPGATLESGTAGGETLPPAAQSTPNVTPESSVSNQDWIPADVPIPKNVNARGFVGSPRSFSYLTDLSFTAALGYYQRSMEEYGWTQVDYGTRIGKDGAELQYRKGSRKLTVRIAAVSFVGTIVEIEEWV